MARWTPCGQAFIVSDVVRWVEVVWIEKGKRKKKPVKAGVREMTAEIKKDLGRGLVSASVLKCEIMSSVWEPLKPYKKGEIVNRKRGTIERGAGHRMIWTDEGARSQIVSKFLG
jgi:hypothetical protein